MTVTCEECSPPRELNNAGALRIHAIAKHGAAAGTCDLCVPPKEFKNLASHQARSHREKIDAGGGAEPSGPGAAPAGASPADEDTGTAERPPSIPDGIDLEPPAGNGARPKFSERVRSKLWGDKGADKAAPSAPAGDLYGTTPREKRPRGGILAGKRSTTAPLLGLAWGGAGALLERTGTDIPVGRTLQLQADMAGDILDRLVARTWVDRLLQPIASKTDDVEALSALIALPILVGAIERSGPAAATTIEPLLRMAISVNLEQMGPVIKKRRESERKLAKAVAEIDPGLAGTDDPVAAILAVIFAPPPGAGAAPGAPVDNGNAATAPAG